jgi:hypothetical protein
MELFTMARIFIFDLNEDEVKISFENEPINRVAGNC